MFNLLGVSPPIVGFGVGNREKGIPKDTAINIARSHEFVINLVDESLVDAMSVTADAFPQGISELEKVGATTAPSSLIATPRIAQAQVSMECTEWGTLNIGNNRVVIGLVKRLYLRDELFDTQSKTVRGERFFPVGHLTGMHCYSRSNGRFDLPHPLPL